MSVENRREREREEKQAKEDPDWKKHEKKRIK